MRIPTSLLACTASLLLSAQGPESTVKTDTGTVVLHRFTTGQLSSKAWMDADNRWGHSWAYDRTGKVILGGTAKAGDTVASSGAGGPYKVILGNVKGVESLAHNGAPVDFKSANRNNVARLTLQ